MGTSEGTNQGMTRGANRSRARRAIAGLVAMGTLMMAAPQAALAEDEFWGLWATGVIERPVWEVPFVIIVSLPAMLITTPFWATGKAVEAIKGIGSGDGEDDNS